MPLRLIVGRANSGKTGVAYDEVRRAITSGRPAVLLLPSAPDVNRAVGELSETHALGVRCVQMGRYLSQLWAQCGDGRREVTPLQRRVLLTGVAQSAGVLSRGLVRLGERCVRELAEQTGTAWRGRSPGELGPGADLGALISGYAARLDVMGLVEPAEATRWLADETHLPDQVIVAHRFTDFTPSQEAFLVGASAMGREVTITLSWEQGFVPTEALSELVERLEAHGARSERVGAGETYGTVEELLTIEAGLFAKPTSLHPRGAVRLVTAEGPEAEAIAIAGEVRRLIEEESVNSGQIAVVFRAPRNHAPQLAEAFSDAEIDADFDVPVRFKATTFGRAFSSLVAFGVGGDRAALLAFLRTRFSAADPDALSALEAKWRRGGVKAADLLAKDTTVLGAPTRSVVQRAISTCRQSVGAGTVEVWTALVDSLLVNGIGRSAAMLGASAGVDVRAASIVNRLLGDVAELETSGISAGEFLEVLAEQELAPDTAEQPGHVQVTGVTRMRARRFDAVILAGLNAEEFPARPAEDMLHGSAVGRVMQAFGGEPGQRLGDPYERLLFYQILTRPRRFLTLSACTADAAGELMQVSPLLEEVLDFYRDGEELTLPRSHRPLAQVPELGAGVHDRDELRAAAFFGDVGDPRVAAADQRSGMRAGGRLGPAVLEELARRDVFSASEIETYLACPYRWFHERALKPEELDREWGAVDEGTNGHELLAEFYRRAPETIGAKRVSPANLSAALSALERIHAEQDTGARSRSLAEQLSREAVFGWARRLLGDDARLLPGFEPERLEWEFTSEPVDMGGYALVGRVDRVDVNERGEAVVMDYKRSGASKAADILTKGKVQLPLYSKAVEERLGLTVVGGLYRALVKRDDRGLLLAGAVGGPLLCGNDFREADEFTALRAQALDLAAEAVAGMRAGEIPSRPRTPTACAYCRAADVCGGGVA